jgi:glutamine synthetase
MSLWDAGGRLTFSTGREASPTFRHFLGGLLARRRAGLVLRADGQLVQALQRGAQLRASSGRRQPHGGLRVVGAGPSLRVSADPGADANPYLTYAALPRQARRIERELDPNEPFAGDALPQCRAATRAARWPTRFAAGGGRFTRDAFSDAVVDRLLHFARTELASYEAVVTDFERATSNI